MVQFGSIHHERLVGSEDREVGVVAEGQLPLGRQAHTLRRFGGHPLDHLLQPEAAAPRLGPDQRQPELNRGDPAPGHAEVTVVEILELQGGR